MCMFVVVALSRRERESSEKYGHSHSRVQDANGVPSHALHRKAAQALGVDPK